MLQFEELKLKLETMAPQIDDLADSIGLTQLKRQADELDAQAAAPGFWDDMETAKRVTQKTAILKAKIDNYEKLHTEYQDTMTLIELANEEEDLSLLDECTEGVDRIEKSIETQRLATLLSGEYDSKNAILTFHAGAGGTEAQDWASMLYRMYTHWAESHGFQYNILDYLDGDEAGIKSASIEIVGENAYGYLKGEAGVHRLVRISPFDASGRRHTSFSAHASSCAPSSSHRCRRSLSASAVCSDKRYRHHWRTQTGSRTDCSAPEWCRRNNHNSR